VILEFELVAHYETGNVADGHASQCPAIESSLLNVIREAKRSSLRAIGAHSLELIAERDEESIDERDAAAQFRPTKFIEQSQEPRRLDGGFARAAQRLARGDGDALKQVGIDGAEHLAEDE
jgi:hypothetical protein